MPPHGSSKDCLQCKIVGVSTFSGIAGYATYLRAVTPRNEIGQRFFLGCFALGAVGIAVARAIY